MSTQLNARAVELATLVEQSLLAPAASIGVELPLIGVSEVPHQPVLAYAGDRPWFFCSYVDDPTAERFGGRIPVPEPEHRRLVSLRDAGVCPSLVWLAHEVPVSEWQEGQALPDLVPPDVRPVVRPGTLSVGGRRLAVQVVRNVVEGTVTSLGRVSRALANLDPIVLIAVTDPAGKYACWVESARWSW